MFTIYGQPRCSYCASAKKLLDNRGIQYKYIDISKDKSALTMLRDKGLRTVPQIWSENEVYIGGYEDLVRVL